MGAKTDYRESNMVSAAGGAGRRVSGNSAHRADERVAIFIDGSNLYHSLEENCRRYDVDFGAFGAKLTGDRRLVRVYYYNVLRDPDRNPQAYQDQQKFLSALGNVHYLEVRLGGSKMRGATSVEKGIDIMLATDLLKFAWGDMYDVAVLVTGDGDFAYAVETVKNMGKHVEIAAFPANLSWELANVADERIYFTPSYFGDLWSRRRDDLRHAAQAPPPEPVTATDGAAKPLEPALPQLQGSPERAPEPEAPKRRAVWRFGRQRGE